MEPKKRGRPLKADAKRARLDLRMEPWLIERVRAEAKREGVAPSEIIRRVLTEKFPPSA